MNTNPKPVYKSWTIWWGIVQILYGVIGGLAGYLDTAAAYSLVVAGIGTIGFRFKTAQPVG